MRFYQQQTKENCTTDMGYKDLKKEEGREEVC